MSDPNRPESSIQNVEQLKTMSDPNRPQSSDQNAEQVLSRDMFLKKRLQPSSSDPLGHNYLCDLLGPNYLGRRVAMNKPAMNKPRTKYFCQMIPIDFNVNMDVDVVPRDPEPLTEMCKLVNQLDVRSPLREPFSEINKELRTMENYYDAFLPPSPFPYCNNPRVVLVDDKNSCGMFSRRERGTTTLAFIFKYGVMLASDHPWKWSVPNVIEVNSQIIATLSGGGERLLKDLQRKCCDYESKMGRSISTSKTAELLAESIYPSMLTGGLLIGGWDEKGPALYHVNREGKLENVREKRTLLGTPLKWISYATGSGASRAMIYMDEKMRYDMSVADAEEVAKAAICFASFKATEIGSCISVYHIASTGWKKLISGYDPKEWQKENLKSPKSREPITISIYPPDL